MPVYRVNIQQQLFSQNMMNVMYYETTSALSGAQLVEVADAIRAAYVSSGLTSRLDNGWSFIQISARRVDVANLPEIEVAPTAGSLSGAAAAEALPTQVALLVSGTSVNPYPRNVRTYIPAMTEGVSVNGLFSDVSQEDAVDFIEAIDSITVTGDTLNRVAVTIGGEAGSPVVTDWNRVETYSSTPVPATQRRRRLGVGI